MIHNWENYFDTSSEYWLKVEKIYEENESFPKKVVKERNLHHKFPRSFSKKDGADIDNDVDNLVSLSLADHFRVHYYLWKCSKKGYRAMMAKAFVFMRKKVVIYASDDTIEKLARDYESAMKDAVEVISKAMKGNKYALGHHHSDETRKKISEGNKGKQAGEKHPFYGRHHSEDAKRRQGATWKGRRHSEESKKKMSEAQKGKPKSEEHKKKISEEKKGNTYTKGKHWYNNGKINTMSKECPPGFVPGRIK